MPSITTIIDVLAQDLEWWEALCTARLALDHAHVLADVQAMFTGPEKWGRERAAKDWLVGAAERDRGECSARGDLVHSYAEVYCLLAMGQATQADLDRERERCEAADIMKYVAQFHAFWMDYKPRPLQAEATVWNSTLGYAGTTDLICEIDTQQMGRVVAVVDWKTKRKVFKRNGKPKDSDLRDFTGMQLAAAAMAEEVWVPGKDPAQDVWVPFPYQAQVGLAVAIGPDGFAVRQFDIYAPVVWRTFAALRSAWDFTQEGALTMSARLAGPGSIKALTPPPHEVTARTDFPNPQNGAPSGVALSA